jgi:cbb3-type cytochrome oxidase subunit 3
MKSRPAIATALALMAMTIFVVGIVWIVLYYGGILGVYNSVIAQFGTGVFDSTDLTFVMAFAGFWLFICTMAMLYWLWQRSQKQGLQ